MKQLILSLMVGLLLSTPSFASLLDIEPVSNWTEYRTFKGVRIEYVFQECNSKSVQNQTLVLFRFINTTNLELTINWKIKTFRNGFCSNCLTLKKKEALKELTLSPGEVLEGDCSSKVDKRRYLFSHFIVKSPGMSDSILTDFQFVEMKVN